MKKVLLLAMAIMFISCGSKDIKQEQIAAKVLENAMGNDLKYEPIETKEIAQVSYQDILDVFYKDTEIEPQTMSDNIITVENGIKKARLEDNTEDFHYYEFMLSRLKKYEAAKDKKAIDYKIYKQKYSIHPMQNDFKVMVTNYYFFDSNDKLLGYADEDKFKETKEKLISHEKSPYEYLLYEITK